MRNYFLIAYLFFMITSCGAPGGHNHDHGHDHEHDHDHAHAEVKTTVHYEQEKNFAVAFSKDAGEAKAMLDSINRSGVQTELLDGKISEKLNTLNLMIDKDSTSVKKLYQDIVQNYADLQAAKKQLRDAKRRSHSETALSQRWVRVQ